MVHYITTYGFGCFDRTGHSLLEDYMGRTVFNEKTNTKDFVVLKESDAVIKLEEYIDGLTSNTRPLSDSDYELVLEHVNDGYVISCGSKNLAIKLLIDTRDVRFADAIQLFDVIKLVSELNYQVYGNKNMKKLNLKNKDRKFITEIIDHMFDTNTVKLTDIMTCCEKKKLWNGLLHHIHYRSSKENARSFVELMRGKINISANGKC